MLFVTNLINNYKISLFGSENPMFQTHVFPVLSVFDKLYKIFLHIFSSCTETRKGKSFFGQRHAYLDGCFSC